MAAEALAARDRIGVQDFVLLEDFRSLDAFSDNLKKRFNEKLIYTYIGPVLVSVNPYRDLDLYTNALCKEYRKVEFFKLPPHVFAIADTAYFAMRSDRQDQCILVSGESGAGKTEATKQILKYLAVASEKSHEVGKIKDRLLQSNPLLEAFGNATTTRNDNSSRFGKYMDVQFDYHGAPVGGHILNYLLEKSRVVQQAPGERNFHIFYQVLASGDKALLQRLSLTTQLTDYRYLAATANYRDQSETVFTIRDDRQFKETMDALKVLAFSQQHMDEIFNIVAAILHMSNITFSANPEDSNTAVVDAGSALATAAKLMGSTAETIRKALLHKTILVQGSKVTSPLNLEESLYGRDAMTKTIYDRLFSWLVSKVNKALEVKRRDTAVIGLLDIYGFEVFQTNSFEQFCINYCNEKLQQIFIELTLKLEQEEYQKEGIQWEQIDYFNNKVILDLIEDKNKGVIAMLDEECTRPGTVSDASFLDKMASGIGQHKHFVCFELADRDVRKTIGRDEFRLVHYAGDVTYNVKGFIEKNNDLLFRDIKEASQQSSNSIMRDIFPNAEIHDKKRPVTAGTQFKASLNRLADIVKSKVPSYVRCIKPNNKKSAVMFDDVLVHHQVKYLGLMENLRVRRAGFAYRRDYNYFYNRYKAVCPKTWPNYRGKVAEACQKIADMLSWNGQDFKVGKTKVFIRNPRQLYEIEDRLAKRKNELAVLLQANARGMLARRRFQKVRAAVTVFSKNWRRKEAGRELRRRKRAAGQIRSFVKGFMMRNDPPNEFNKNFVRITRQNWLLAVLARNLPKTVLDADSWPSCPRACQATSDLLKPLHRRTLVRNYMRTLTPERKQQLSWKLQCSEAFRGKKSTYKSALPKPFAPNRLESGLSQRVLDTVGKTATDGPGDLVFADNVTKYDRHGYKARPRIIAATVSAVFLLDPKNLAVKETLPAGNIKAIVLSSLSDGFVMLVMDTINKGEKGDLLLSSERVIELATLIASSCVQKADAISVQKGELTHNLAGNKKGTIQIQAGATPSIAKGGSALVVVGAE